MFNKMKTLGLAAAFAVAAPIASFAATLSGQIDITGAINLAGSEFTETGSADLLNPGVVVFSSGDFGLFTNLGDLVVLTDADFAAPGAIWEVGGFTFTATAFHNFTNDNVNNVFGFDAVGLITGNGYDATQGRLEFSAQSSQAIASFSSTTVVPLPAGLLLMGTALAGLGMTRRKKA